MQCWLFFQKTYVICEVDHIESLYSNMWCIRLWFGSRSCDWPFWPLLRRPSPAQLIAMAKPVRPRHHCRTGTGTCLLDIHRTSVISCFHVNLSYCLIRVRSMSWQHQLHQDSLPGRALAAWKAPPRTEHQSGKGGEANWREMNKMTTVPTLAKHSGRSTWNNHQFWGGQITSYLDLFRLFVANWG